MDLELIKKLNVFNLHANLGFQFDGIDRFEKYTIAYHNKINRKIIGKMKLMKDKNMIAVDTYNKIAQEYDKEFGNDYSDTPYVDKFFNKSKEINLCFLISMEQMTMK